MLRGWRSLAVLVGVSFAALAAAPGPTAPAGENPAAPATPDAAEGPPPSEKNPAPEKYKLAYKFLPNQTIHYEVFNETEITTTVKEETETVRNSSESKRHYVVKAVDENSGNGDLELYIDWVHMVASFHNPARAKSPPVEFQSDDPEKQPEQFKDILATVGKSRATIRFNPAGNVVRVLKGDLPASSPTAGKSPRKSPAPDASPEAYFFPLPDEPVALGGTWKDRVNVVCRDNDKIPVKITIQRNYRLTGVKGKLATIELKTVVLTPVQDPAIAGQLIQREISGNLVFDFERGLVVSRETGVDNTVIGPFGPKSSIQARSMYREKLVEEAAVTGQNDNNETARI
jgi:hypothetical protein